MPAPRHHWTQTDTNSCHVSIFMYPLTTLVEEEPGLRSHQGSLLVHPPGFRPICQKTEAQLVLGKGHSSLNSLPLPDSFLSSPVCKPANCDSLIGVGKERQQEAGRGDQCSGRRWLFWDEGEEPWQTGLRKLYAGRSGRLAHGFPISFSLDQWSQCCAYLLVLSAFRCWGSKSYAGRPRAEGRLMQKMPSGLTERLSSLLL